MAFEGLRGLGSLARGKGAIMNGSAVCGRKGAEAVAVVSVVEGGGGASSDAPGLAEEANEPCGLFAAQLLFVFCLYVRFFFYSWAPKIRSDFAQKLILYLS